MRVKTYVETYRYAWEFYCGENNFVTLDAPRATMFFSFSLMDLITADTTLRQKLLFEMSKSGCFATDIGMPPSDISGEQTIWIFMDVNYPGYALTRDDTIIILDRENLSFQLNDSRDLHSLRKRFSQH